MYRKKLSGRKNRRLFSGGAKRVRALNLGRPLSRGGYRL